MLGITVALALPLSWHSSIGSISPGNRPDQFPALPFSGLTFFGHWLQNSTKQCTGNYLQRRAHTSTHCFAPCTVKGIVDFGGFFHPRYSDSNIQSLVSVTATGVLCIRIFSCIAIRVRRSSIQSYFYDACNTLWASGSPDLSAYDHMCKDGVISSDAPVDWPLSFCRHWASVIDAILILRDRKNKTKKPNFAEVRAAHICRYRMSHALCANPAAIGW